METDWDLVDAAMHNPASAGSSGRNHRRRRGEAPPQVDDEETRKQERNRQIALHHANLLQQRKDIEASILKSTILLIDYPTAKDGDPARPSPDDARSVKEHLKHFQPLDYDALLQERNIEKKCAYVLCPRNYQEDNHRGKFAILHKNNDLKIVKTKDLRRWCSEQCARRAMYLRVQLSETPAWERQGANQLQLYEGDGRDEPTAQSEAVAKMTSDLRKLALERGGPNVDKLMNDFQEMSIPNR